MWTRILSGVLILTVVGFSIAVLYGMFLLFLYALERTHPPDKK